MNARQLAKLGVPDDCVHDAVVAITRAVAGGAMAGNKPAKMIQRVLIAPSDFLDDPHFGDFARSLLDDAQTPDIKPIPYRTWGAAGIDDATHAQMRQAASIPGATGAALMPDAHVGYGLPIGGVLAIDGAVVPYAVGVDIACRMKLSVIDTDPALIDKHFDRYRDAFERGTVFGVGGKWQRPRNHPVMDADWSVSRVTREKRDTAWRQLGTSGSGNHFVEFGLLTLESRDEQLGLDAGTYVALMSHSGSRGAGAAVCQVYSAIARADLPRKYAELDRLAWLDLDSEAGAEYWAAMNLMGEYAAANHAVIHREVTGILGARTIAGVENHHNFAWLEEHAGRRVVVHRKGATPAHAGVLGVIPGSMASPAYVVRGRGEPESLCSAAHGAGRAMSRTKAREKYRFNAVQKDLAKKGVRVLSAGSDEVPGVYKDIDAVMAEQRDLVDVIARFDPKIVKMSADGSKPED